MAEWVRGAVRDINREARRERARARTRSVALFAALALFALAAAGHQCAAPAAASERTSIR